MKIKQTKYKKYKKKIRNKENIHSSKIELEFKQYLENILKLEIETQYSIGTKFYDFKIKGMKILIEFQGTYYHADKRIYEKPINEMQKKSIMNDKKKKVLAKSYGYELLEIWEGDYLKSKSLTKKKIDEVIFKYLNKNNTNGC